MNKACMTILIFTLILLSGCASERSSANQCLRREMFKECLQLIPEGPNKTKYNDWDEVIAQCSTTAYYQSLRKTRSIPLECKA